MIRNYILGMIACTSLVFTSCDKTSQKEDTSSGESTATVQSENKADTTASPLQATTIKFAETTHDFGKINQGEKVEHTFYFTNTGEQPLVISDAKASCGCTLPEWTKDPVLPGKEGKIKVIYDSAGREGKINKTVSVYANTEPSETLLNINVEVIKKDDSKGPFKNKI